MAPLGGCRAEDAQNHGVSGKMNGPLIVVSNRLPFVLKYDQTGHLKRYHSAGGLVTAVAPVVIDCGGQWVGWPGSFDVKPWHQIPESDPNDKGPTAGLKSDQVVPVVVDKDRFSSYYNGCCNGTFWPLFHSMPDRAVFSSETWKDYIEVNEEFAARTLDALRKVHTRMIDEGDTTSIPIIWIHDYQLMVAANMIRQVAEDENLRCKLGFFLHIPFPSWDIMRLFPWDDQVLQGMLACDVVGFHIEDYCTNFMDCCQRRLGCRVDRSNFIVEHEGRTIKIQALPIGIPFNRFMELAQKAPQVIKDEMVILGVDRLDYTKGLVHRVKAFERLLEKHPEYLEKVTLLQVAVPSRTDVREYQSLKEEMDQLIGRVNGRFSRPNWSPIRYIYGCISQEQLAAFYRDSAVALVTPLRDGMNLVAKEFVACQTAKPGVLILSFFAGAGGMMREALLVNPYNIDAVADTLHDALSMPEDERQMRMQQLRRREASMDVDYWMYSFFRGINSVECNIGSTAMDDVVPHPKPLGPDDFNYHLNNYVDDVSKVCVLLDYDGTLAPIAAHPDLAKLSEDTRSVLTRLSEMPDVSVCVTSGRSLENLRKMVGIDGITYAGSQGLEILHPDGSRFIHPIPSEHQERLGKLLKSLQAEVCTHGAWVENKGALLTYHYRETPPAWRDGLIKRAVEIFAQHGFEPHHVKMAIEARPPVCWDKGRASLYILRTIYGVDWPQRVKILYVGDDEADEDAMLALQGIACTFRVSPYVVQDSVANFRLLGPVAVRCMLLWLEKKMATRGQKPVSRSPVFDSDLLITCIHSVMTIEDEPEPEVTGTTTRRRRLSSMSSWPIHSKGSRIKAAIPREDSTEAIGH